MSPNLGRQSALGKPNPSFVANELRGPEVQTVDAQAGGRLRGLAEVILDC